MSRTPRSWLRKWSADALKNDWEGFTWSDARRTAVALLDNPSLRTEARFQQLLNFLLDQIGTEGNRRYTRALYRAYLETFDPKSELTQKLAKPLHDHWPETGLAIQPLIDAFEIFNVDKAPQAIAAFMDKQNTPFEALQKQGIENPHGSGLMQDAHKHFIYRQKQRIETGEYLTVMPKLMSWIKPADSKVPLENGAGPAINALLLPWTSNLPGMNVDKSNLERSAKIVKSCLIDGDGYGDPRFKRLGAWSKCSSEALTVVRSWMVGDTIKIFFQIITEADKTEADKSRMWSNRRKLWDDLYKDGHITEAWFVLSRDGEGIAQRLERSDPNHVKIPFAQNISGSADRKKCLLLMKINKHWVVEGSHSFKTHVFDQNDNTSVKALSATLYV